MKKRGIIFALSVLSLSLMSCDKDNSGDNSKTKSTNVTESESKSEESISSESKSEESISSESKTNESKDSSTSLESIISTIESESTESTNTDDGNKTTIYLAGDSTVKTYKDDQYIGGWGQYFDLFLDDSVDVVNCAEGGRSSRSFINEGRLYDIENNTYFKGNSIGDSIKEGDYLFIQFGHNDDDTKSGNTLADRMVPLGDPDSDGIYPTTPGVKTEIKRDSNGNALDTSISDEVKSKMSGFQSQLDTYLTNSINKYGDSYYEYSSGGTYKWFLKQYIDFARENGATPVLVTPVSRVKFSNGEIIGGAGLHGENFAYVNAVRQLASEENCLLVDLFKDTKIMLETATKDYANFLMALKPNDLLGSWPIDYDKTYENTKLGYTGIEATHYNKFGAYLTCAKLVEQLNDIIEENKTGLNGENIAFKNSLLLNPEEYIVPSNRMSKTIINNLFDLFDTVKVKADDFQFPDPKELKLAINDMKNAYPEVTNENYIEVGKICEELRLQFYSINVDDVSRVSNIGILEYYESLVQEFVVANRPVATETIIFDPSSLSLALDDKITDSVTSNGFKIVATTDYPITIKSGASFTYNDVEYSTSKSLAMGGAASFGSYRYVEFTTTKNAKITVIAKSTGSDDRIVKMVSSANQDVASFKAGSALSITSQENVEAGTYKLGSAGSGIYIYQIIIEYFD